MTNPSPLAFLMCRRALNNAYERIEDLQGAVKGLLWLCNMVANRADGEDR